MSLAALMMGINEYQGDTSVLELDAASNAILQQQMSPINLRIEGDAVGVSYVQQQLKQYDKSRQVAPVLIEHPIENSDSYDYRLVVKQRHYHVYLANEQRPLFSMQKHYNADSEHKVLQQLKHKARWRQKLYLNNPNTTLPLDAVSIVTEYEGAETVDSDLLLHYHRHDPDSEQWQQPCFKLKLSLHPNITHPLYCVLFYFDAHDGYIGTELLEGAWLIPNETIEVSAFNGHFIPTSVSEPLRQQGIMQTQDFIKLMVSESTFDATPFQQQGLDQNQQQHVNTRGMRVPRKKTTYTDWMSKSIRITTVYPDDKQSNTT